MFLGKLVYKRQLGNASNDVQKDRIDLRFLLSRYECRSDTRYGIQEMIENSSSPPFCVQYSQVKGQEHIYALACEDGEIIFVNSNLPSKKSLIKHWNAHNNAVFDICWLRHLDQLITVAGDHNVILWDTTTLKKVSCFKGHASSVKTLSLKPDNESVFVTGSRDGNVLLWDSRSPAESHHKPVSAISGVHDAAPATKQRKRLRKGTAPFVANPMNSITCVLFQDENVFLSTGASDWSIKGWDIRWLQRKSDAPVPLFNVNNAVENHKTHGYTSMVMNPDGKSFFANCTDGTISQYETSRNTPSLMSTYHGHKVGTFFVKMNISGDGQFIVSGSSNDKAYIWQVSKPGIPVVALEGHDAEVTAVAWHPQDITKLVTCGDDDQVFHWSVGYPKDEKDPENPLVGTAHIVNPEEVRLPSHLHNPVSHATPSCRFTDSPGTLKAVTPSTSNKSPSVTSLTQWLTPKNKTTECLIREYTPEISTNATIITPVKAPPRPVFSELGNNDHNQVTRIRRTINFGSNSEPRPTGQSHAKRVKLGSSPRNYSIKKFFPVSPRTSV